MSNLSFLLPFLFALVFGSIPAFSAPISLGPGQTSYAFRGGIDGPIMLGGIADYSSNDDNGIVLGTGRAMLQAPIEGASYTISIEALDSQGIPINLFLTFEAIHFTSARSFGRFQLPGCSYTNACIEGNWDNTGLGGVGLIGIFRAQTSPVPETATGILLVLGLIFITFSQRIVIRQNITTFKSIGSE